MRSSGRGEVREMTAGRMWPQRTRLNIDIRELGLVVLAALAASGLGVGVLLLAERAFF